MVRCEQNEIMKHSANRGKARSARCRDGLRLVSRRDPGANGSEGTETQTDDSGRGAELRRSDGFGLERREETRV